MPENERSEFHQKSELLNTLLGLAMIVKVCDPYTGGHLWRVSQFAKWLAQQAGRSQREVALCAALSAKGFSCHRHADLAWRRPVFLAAVGAPLG